MSGFCALPFVQYSTYNHGRYRLCCMAKEPAEELNQNHLSMEQIWNSDYMKQVRRDMLAGKWSPECTECDHLERNGIGSSRQWENQKWQEYTATLDENVSSPVQFDFRLGNMCNLHCQMCNKDASHLVSVERAKIKEKYGAPVQHEDWERVTANKKEALLQPGIDWNTFEPMIPHAREIKMIGGEPTVFPDMFRLLDYCTENDYAKNIELSFYTNITNMQDRWLEQLGQFKRVVVNCSLEGMGAMNDYLRPPSKWDSVWKNFTKLRDFASTKAGKRIKVRVTTVNQITNALHLPDFFEMLHDYQITQKRGIGLSSNQLIEPAYYSMQHAPDWLKKEQKRKIKKLLHKIGNSKHFETWQEALMDCVNFAEDPKHIYNESHMRDYVRVTEVHDKFRNDDVMKVSPEFARLKSEIGVD